MLPKDLPVFRHHQVASLAWAVGSAPLLKQSVQGLSILDEEQCDHWFFKHEAWFLELDKNPSSLLAWLEHDSQKLLGRRFESMLAYFFSHSPYFHVLHQQVVLMDGKNTVGEIDFIVEDLLNEEILHIEVACKYYIGLENTTDWQNWIGPNGHDSLYLKMEKLKKQVGVFSRQAGKTFLIKQGLHLPRSVVFLKGFFFHHFTRILFAKAPTDAHPHYNSGWFVYQSELLEFSDTYSQWLVLPKMYWTCPYRFPASEIRVLSGEEMSHLVSAEIHRTQKARMIMQVRIEDGLLWELSRGFVLKG